MTSRQRPYYSAAAVRGAVFGAGITLVGVIVGLVPTPSPHAPTTAASSFVAVVTGALFGAVFTLAGGAILRGVRRKRFRARFGEPDA